MMNSDGRNDAPETTATNEKALGSSGRREALKKMALYSAYATPALLALMHSNKAHAVTSILD